MKFTQLSLKHAVVLICLIGLAITVWAKFWQVPLQEQLDRALAKSVSAGEVNSARSVLSQGADIRNCLDLAIQNRDQAMIDLLLEHGAPAQMSARVVWATRDQQLIDRFAKLGAIPTWEDIGRMIQASDVELVTRILPHVSQIPDPPMMHPNKQQLSEKWEQLFLLAVYAPNDCRAELIEKLIAAHPEPCLSALQAAVWNRKQDAILKFRSHGYRYGLSEMIALGRTDEVREYLLENPRAVLEKIDSPEVKNAPILNLSLWHRNIAISHLLLDAGAPTEGTGDDRDQSILLAVQIADIDLMRRVLEKSASWYDPRSLKLVELGSNSPIVTLLANEVAKPEVLKFLLEAGFPLCREFGPELQYAVNGLKGCSPQQYAKQIETIRILREAGAARFSDPFHQHSIDDYCRANFVVEDLNELLETTALQLKPVGPTP